MTASPQTVCVTASPQAVCVTASPQTVCVTASTQTARTKEWLWLLLAVYVGGGRLSRAGGPKSHLIQNPGCWLQVSLQLPARCSAQCAMTHGVFTWSLVSKKA